MRRLAVVTLALLVSACADPERRRFVADSIRKSLEGESARSVAQAGGTTAAAVAATTSATDTSALHAPVRLPPLSDAARSVANAVVFAPRLQEWFVAAVRGKRLLVDVGRWDGRESIDSATRVAIGEAAQRYAPLRVGSTVRLRGPWGVEDAQVASFSTYNGRVVARLHVSRALDSLVKNAENVAGSAQRVIPVPAAVDSTHPADSTATASPSPATAAPAPASGASTAAAPTARAGRSATATTGTPATTATPAAAPTNGAPATPTAPAASCRDTLPTPLAQRVAQVQDSVVQWLNDSTKSPIARLEKGTRLISWRAAGCFGPARAAVIVSRRNPTGELAVERALLVAESGALTKLRIADLRFHAHEVITIADVDGDGVDDVMARGYGDHGGATTALRLDPVKKTFSRLAAGFAWESR